jgi:hypothetical protein
MDGVCGPLCLLPMLGALRVREQIPFLPVMTPANIADEAAQDMPRR